MYLRNIVYIYNLIININLGEIVVRENGVRVGLDVEVVKGLCVLGFSFIFEVFW